MKKALIVLAALAVPVAYGSAFGQPVAQTVATPSAAPSSADIPGWDAFVASLHDLPGQMLAKLPPAMRNDPQVRAEVGRLMLESLATSALDAVGRDGDYPVFLPSIGQALNIGQPNADTVYRFAQITPGGSYRLRGTRGSDRIAKIGQNKPSPYEKQNLAGPVGAVPIYEDLNALHVDAQDRFDVLLSPTRPAGYGGDWWQLLPATNKLFLRMVKSDWDKERDPTIAIERVDLPMGRPRMSAAQLQARLEQLPLQTRFSAILFVDHVAKLAQQGYVNKLKILDVSQMGGLAGQFYYEGDYDLTDDEALIVETKVPARCQYRSMILTNEIYETTDWIDNQSSLNDTQAQPDKDGILRVVVSTRDPGVPNWLDTAGYRQGLIQGRWTNCSDQPIPIVRKVAFGDIRKALPPATGQVTPAQRERIIRDRRLAYQLRPLW